MRPALAVLLLLAMPAFAWAKPAPTFYVCAHPDDCILFMNPNLYDDIAASNPVVILYLTSGDAGKAFSAEAKDDSYPYVRERASLDATEWGAEVNKDPITATEVTETVRVHGHTITRVRYGETVSYFLRLPDGNFDGGGFALFGFHSLRKLKASQVKDVQPIDGSGVYADWQDLVATLSGILAQEAPDAKAVTLHIQDPDVAANTQDHSDHTVGGSGVMEALALDKATQACYLLYKHIDYSIAQKPVNLEGLALADKAGSFAVLTATQRRALTHHDWNEWHTAYLPRNYYTTATVPEGCAKGH